MPFEILDVTVGPPSEEMREIVRVSEWSLVTVWSSAAGVSVTTRSQAPERDTSASLPAGMPISFFLAPGDRLYGVYTVAESPSRFAVAVQPLPLVAEISNLIELLRSRLERD